MLFFTKNGGKWQKGQVFPRLGKMWKKCSYCVGNLSEIPVKSLDKIWLA
jgi:hypothetical protein